MKKPTILVFLLIVFITTFAIALLQNTQDNLKGTWTCKSGVWVAEGTPANPQPTEGCGLSDEQKHALIEANLRANISTLSPADPVLGGTFYVTFISFLSDGSAIVEYEDGHIALTGKVVAEVLGETVTIRSFTLFEDSFNKSGNLMKDNPGLPPGVWHLNYDEQGAPGRSVSLEFSSDTVCQNIIANTACAMSDLTAGDRVRVYGEKQGDMVTVRKIER